MSHFVYDDTNLVFPKVNLIPLPDDADASNYISAPDWNTLNQAVEDTKDLLRGAKWYGLLPQGSDPVPGPSNYLWLTSSGLLAYKFSGAAVTIVPSSRSVIAGTGLTGGGNLTSNVTISLANTAVTPGSYTNANVTVDQQGRITAASNGTGGSGGSGRGLFNPIASAVPTMASTGFDWFYQNTATATDEAMGVTVKAPTTSGANHWMGLARAVPTTPYSVRMLLSVDADPFNTQNGAAFVGFLASNTSASQQQVFYWKPGIYTAGAPAGNAKNNSATSVNLLTDGSYTYFKDKAMVWFRLTDDGTIVRIYASITGNPSTFYQVFTATKAGSFLGASGYNYLAFGIIPSGGPLSISLLSFEIEP